MRTVKCSPSMAVDLLNSHPVEIRGFTTNCDYNVSEVCAPKLLRCFSTSSSSSLAEMRILVMSLLHGSRFVYF